MSLVVFINRLMSGVIALSYVSISHALTPAGSFLGFAVLSAVSVVFYYKCVPETAGKTLEEVCSCCIGHLIQIVYCDVLHCKRVAALQPRETCPDLSWCIARAAFTCTHL
jgi:hypothetical protein